MSHALLSPSSASRWLTCTPSARLEAQEPNTGSVYAAEGTLAHSLGELLIKEKLGLILQKEYKAELKRIEEHSLFTTAMWDHCQDYAAFVVEEYRLSQAHTKDAHIVLEQKVDYSHLVPGGYGTLDNTIVADWLAKIIDLKYGQGVPVSAEDNKQLKLYALGVVEELSLIYNIREIELIIYQPRLDSISRFKISVEELLAWGQDFVKPQAAKAFKGEGTLIAGDHCRFCRVRAKCRANYELQMETVAHDFTDLTLLKPEEISDILMRATTFENWLKAVKEYALASALKDGIRWPGMKVVEGKSNRQYTDETEIADLLKKKGLGEEHIYTKKLVGITNLQKLLGSVDFNTLVGPYLVKPTGKPVLVPESDKRPELQSFESMQNEFTDLSEPD